MTEQNHSESPAQERVEHAVRLLASNHRRLLQVDGKGRWGFSQSSGYVPTAYFDTLQEAIQAEVGFLRDASVNAHAAVVNTQRKADALDADIAVLDAIAPTQNTPEVSS